MSELASNRDPDPFGAAYSSAVFATAACFMRSADPRPAPVVQLHGVGADPAMLRVDRALLDLRASGRRALRILDVGCAGGGWLIDTAFHALMLGFVAVEGRGVDIAPHLVDRARTTTAGIRDPRLGLTFDVADIGAALAEEDDHGVDIMLWHYGLVARLPLDRHEHALAELQRVTAAGLICLGAAQ